MSLFHLCLGKTVLLDMRFGIDHFHFQHCKSPSCLLDTIHSDMSAVIIELSLSVMSCFSLTTFRIFFLCPWLSIFWLRGIRVWISGDSLLDVYWTWLFINVFHQISGHIFKYFFSCTFLSLLSFWYSHFIDIGHLMVFHIFLRFCPFFFHLFFSFLQIT